MTRISSDSRDLDLGDSDGSDKAFIGHPARPAGWQWSRRRHLQARARASMATFVHVLRERRLSIVLARTEVHRQPGTRAAGLPQLFMCPYLLVLLSRRAGRPSAARGRPQERRCGGRVACTRRSTSSGTSSAGVPVSTAQPLVARKVLRGGRGRLDRGQGAASTPHGQARDSRGVTHARSRVKGLNKGRGRQRNRRPEGRSVNANEPYRMARMARMALGCLRKTPG